jgi:hypothetical protein
VSKANLEALAGALGESDVVARDAALSKFASCERFAPGVVLALRAELAPVECGDMVIGSELPSGIAPELSETLVALSYAAHLKRLVVQAPRLAAPFSKAEFAEFSKSTLNNWIVTQAQAIHKVALAGVKLSGYARGVVAVEAGLADMRFVGAVRDVPLPEEMADDKELAEVYYSELDVALGPWKQRGRDAALLGLAEFAALGVLADARVARARRLLSELYGGRRINRLDGLILPELPPVDATTTEARLATWLPTQLLGSVLPDLDARSPGILRALLERGVPPHIRADLSTARQAPVRALLARALVQLGQRYWRSADFQAAASLLNETAADSPEARLIAGLAEALARGPRDATDMMLRGVKLPTGEANVRALDDLSKSEGPVAAAAKFNAAYLLELTPPAGDPEFWRKLAGRYTAAEHALADPEHKIRARELARAATDTAAALAP